MHSITGPNSNHVMARWGWLKIRGPRKDIHVKDIIYTFGLVEEIITDIMVGETTGSLEGY